MSDLEDIIEQETRRQWKATHKSAGPILYFSLAAGSQHKTARILEYPYVLINFMTQINQKPKYPLKKLFIDCGGFHSSLLHGEYTKTDYEYLEYVEKMQPDYFALRDYPCEPELLKTHGRTVVEHQDKTIKHHFRNMELIQSYNIKARPVPVLQGWTVTDYLKLLYYYLKYDLIDDYLAIGSICRRGQTKEIRKIILAIRDNLPDFVHLHGFGVKISALRYPDVYDALYSIDSGAWDYTARWNKLKGNVDSSEASLLAAQNYLKKFEGIRDLHENQLKLEV